MGRVKLWTSSGRRTALCGMRHSIALSRHSLFAALLLSLALSAACSLLPAIVNAQTELGSEDDLTVLGANGTALDPDTEIKGFTVFGSTQAAYTGAVVGPGSVVVNGALAVSSGAYFVDSSTFPSAGKIFIGDGSAGQLLSKNSDGSLQWASSSAMGDNLGNHVATTTLNMAGFNIVNVSSVNFLPNVFVTSAPAAQGGGVYVSTNLYTVGYSSAAGYYGDGSTLNNVSTHTYHIGDQAGGGIVYWVDPTNTRVLIAAAADQGSAMQWGNNNNTTGAGLDGVYAGRADTVMISTMQGPGSYAARACADYAVTVSGVYYDDWYLPSKAELQLLYSKSGVVGGFSGGASYWSSTEYVSNTTGAWSVDWWNGYTGYSIKNNTYFVRCVRGGPFSAFDYSRDAETVRNGAYVTSTQTFTGGNTFQLGVTASSFTATGTGISAVQLNLANNVVVSSEASSALGAGVRVSTNMYIVGFSSAAKYYGDGSGLTNLNLAGTGDNLGNHIATTTLNMATFNIVNVGSITANGAITTYSTMTVAGNAFSVGGSTLTVSAGKVGIGTDSPSYKLEVKDTGMAGFQVEPQNGYVSLRVNGVEVVQMLP